MDSARTHVRSLTAPLDQRTAEEVGRCARLELVFARRGNRTVLEHGYAEPPLRVGRWFSDRDEAQMILATSSPGVFGGDAFAQSVTIDSGAKARLASQSAMQVHPSQDDSVSRIRSTYRVGEGGSLRCEWDPLIPFTNARLDHRISIELADGARLFWSDAAMSGRRARGEHWRFASLAHELRVTCGTTLRYLERYRLTPLENRCDRSWIAGQCAYFGTVLVVGPVSAADAERLHHELAAVSRVYAAADVLGDDFLVVRLMSASGAAFREARALVGRWSALPAASSADS